MMPSIKWVVRGVCVLAGVLAVYLPSSVVQRGADSAAQVCESAGLPAYPRGADGEVLPRPEAANGRSVGLQRKGSAWVPVTLPAPSARSTVEEVRTAD
ncbi:hypothetical protein OWM54_41860 [Myxococcus sp. MISCRS1]|uniref:hypothetical protein n=1 Tax=Myxococcus sp. MISCRS1 TaxID=2996786 RepID=UPI00226E51C5|nr:hypothetical protein [Myxococcus sp. MISCRS1]MCY1003710.1 hypothetical protein [Myxococcus sp. MISCRS1]